MFTYDVIVPNTKIPVDCECLEAFAIQHIAKDYTEMFPVYLDVVDDDMLIILYFEKYKMKLYIPNGKFSLGCVMLLTVNSMPRLYESYGTAVLDYEGNMIDMIWLDYLGE